MEKERKREQVELYKQKKREKTLRLVKEDGGRKKDFINATREENISDRE